MYGVAVLWLQEGVGCSQERASKIKGNLHSFNNLALKCLK